MIEIVYQKFYIFFDFKGKLVAKRSEKLKSIKKSRMVGFANSYFSILLDVSPGVSQFLKPY